MEHLSEHTIENLLRDSTLSQRQISRINAHLVECRECRNIYKWLKSFYQELNRLERPSLVDSSVGRHTIGTIKLAPLHFEKPQQDKAQSAMVLVAKSDEPASQCEHIVTLGSEKRHILARILYDNHNQSYKLFLVTPEDLDPAHSVVELSSCQRALVTNQSGKAEFFLKRPPGSQQWENTRGILRMPLARITLDADDIRNFEKDRQLTVSDNGFEFKLTFQSSQRNIGNTYVPDTINIAVRREPQKKSILSKALLKEGDRRQLLTFNGGIASMLWERPGNELQILGYQ